MFGQPGSQTEVSSHLIHRDQPKGDCPSRQPPISVAKPNVIGGSYPNQSKVDRSPDSHSSGGFIAGNPETGRYKANAPNARLVGGGISQSPSSSYGGTPQAAYRQPPPPMLMHSNRGPVAKNEAPPGIFQLRL
ncbi:hypothetical protein RHMOL_Rhmol11G0081400 [Rhododendron molle]|uniref:Uncharacterized protein n=1 Tax=Rhododendron molle TaxID=49168 RepID=A0ACC0LQS5_RHOML|nr:hypothetical protein RHMOL_Rhmol11G0081400 [Rhododendron molle]